VTRINLLILDDWGPNRLNAEQRRDPIEIFDDRYATASTLVTSQLPVDKWHQVVGEPTFADAILDRIVHNAYRLELQGESMRKLQARKETDPSLDRNRGKWSCPAFVEGYGLGRTGGSRLLS
jgi:DNA replication protein DnaC